VLDKSSSTNEDVSIELAISKFIIYTSKLEFKYFSGIFQAGLNAYAFYRGRGTPTEVGKITSPAPITTARPPLTASAAFLSALAGLATGSLPCPLPGGHFNFGERGLYYLGLKSFSPHLLTNKNKCPKFKVVTAEANPLP
jgi:hypothetical protein